MQVFWLILQVQKSTGFNGLQPQPDRVVTAFSSKLQIYVLELTMHAMMLLLHVLIHGLQFNSVRKFVGTSMVGICNISDLLFQV
jgi:hypothetical protein